MRKLFECAPSELYGQYIWDLIPDLEMADIRRVIENRENIYSSMVEVRQKQRAIINLIPNIRNGKCEGAILYLYQKTKIDTLDMQLKQKSYERGLYARYHFEDIIGQSEMMDLSIPGKTVCKTPCERSDSRGVRNRKRVICAEHPQFQSQKGKSVRGD